jgi:molybdopterin synthase catalytic subunit
VAGAPLILVTDKVIDPAAVLAEVASHAHGAQILFTGTVRDLNHDRRVVAISYDVLSPRAERTFAEICAEAQAAAGAKLTMAVVQRRGRIPLGESSIAIGVGAPHRDQAYLASRHLIEEIKRRAPIWKHEHYADGESRWL